MKNRRCLRNLPMRRSAMQQLELLDKLEDTHLAAETEPPPLPKLPCPGPSDPDVCERLTEVIGGPFGAQIREVFALMEVAEELIAERMKRDPQNAETINASFRYLRPTDPLQGLSDDVYRHHAGEIIDRVLAGGDVNLATTAELLGGISKVTTAAPPSRALTLLYAKLFEQVFPGAGDELFSDFSPDAYENERMAELESEFRRKLSTKRDCRG